MAVADIAALERFILNQLTPIPGIEKIRSSFALKQVRYKTALPLPVPGIYLELGPHLADEEDDDDNDNDNDNDKRKHKRKDKDKDKDKNRHVDEDNDEPRKRFASTAEEQLTDYNGMDVFGNIAAKYRIFERARRRRVSVAPVLPRSGRPIDAVQNHGLPVHCLFHFIRMVA